MSSYNSSSVWRGDAEEQEVVNSNATGMQISFLGTAASLTTRTRSAATPFLRLLLIIILAILTVVPVNVTKFVYHYHRQLPRQPHHQDKVSHNLFLVFRLFYICFYHHYFMTSLSLLLYHHYFIIFIIILTVVLVNIVFYYKFDHYYHPLLSYLVIGITIEPQALCCHCALT